MKIVRRSIVTSTVRERELPITERQVAEYQSGIDINKCMPHLSQADKIFFVSGITDDDMEESTISVGHRLDR